MINGLTLEEANIKEVSLIRELDTTNPQKGYNIQEGGRNSKIAESTKEKMRQACIGRPSNRKGKPLSEEHKRKISEANTGKIRSEETKKKISALKSGKNHPNWGKHLSEETKQKIGRKNKGKHRTDEEKENLRKIHSIPVQCVETGVIYDSALQAEKR